MSSIKGRLTEHISSLPNGFHLNILRDARTVSSGLYSTTLVEKGDSLNRR